jgi:hypothetical protein
MSGVHSYNPSPTALRPLMDMFWSPQGWRKVPPPPAALAQAVADGVMFDQPAVRDHDGWFASARRAAESVSVEEVGDAFLESLSTRRLDLRSALGSYAVARVLPEHAFTPRTGDKYCTVCGQYSGAEEDLNVLNFERFKWGGVRHDDVRYAAFDLEQFVRAPRGGSTDADLAIGRELIGTLRQLPDGTSASQAVAHLKMVKSNKAEREVILDILGVCGILETPEHRGYRQSWVAVVDRELPPQHYVERTYPVSWWKGRHGVNDEALRQFLPQLA